MEDNSIHLKEDDRIGTFGGEAWVGDDHFAEYGLTLGNINIHNINPVQMAYLAKVIVDHMIICGHRFEIRRAEHQDQQYELIHLGQ